jgi:hypothetical protein
VFRRDQGGPGTWGQVAKIVASDGAEGDTFGTSVGVSGDNAIVGSPRHDYNGWWSGAAYVFGRDHGGSEAWGQIAKLVAADGAAEDWYGYSVAIDDDTVVVGALGDDDLGLVSGSAYVYLRDQGGPDASGQVGKLIAADGGMDDQLGTSVSISGDTAVAGAPDKDDHFESSGSVYAFDRDQGSANAWGQTDKLPCPPVFIVGGEGFGNAVSISGDTAVIGASRDNQTGYSSGTAFVFQRDHGTYGPWKEIAKIFPVDGGPIDAFGTSVAIDGDTVVIGAPFNDSIAYRSGSAYVYRRDQGGPDAWGQVAKITPPDGVEEGLFGTSVSLSGDIVVVGAPGDDDNGTDSGSAYAFLRDQGGPDAWGLIGKVAPLNGSPLDRFGSSIAISGDTVIIGSPGDFINGFGSGSARLFRLDGAQASCWAPLAEVGPSDGDHYDKFGSAVAIHGSTAVVGAPFHHDQGPNSGDAYVFNRGCGGPGEWGQVAKITNDDGGTGASLGSAVAINDVVIVVGGKCIDPVHCGPGSASVFHRDHGGAGAWGQVARVVPLDGWPGDEFGSSAALSGATAIIGAPWNESVGQDSGAAYVFVIADILFMNDFETGDTSLWSVTVP